MAAPYGIDAIVQQRVDANRNNPGALANNYQQNQQLVDLLALQKLKMDKEAAARDVQMQMQGNPQTIMQQREQQVMDMTKQEVAQRVGMTGENQEREAQARLQGIAGMPAPNMQGMAEGGIVPRRGYQDGGTAKIPARSTTEELRNPNPLELFQLMMDKAPGTTSREERAKMAEIQKANPGMTPLEAYYAARGEAMPATIPEGTGYLSQDIPPLSREDYAYMNRGNQPPPDNTGLASVAPAMPTDGPGIMQELFKGNVLPPTMTSAGSVSSSTPGRAEPIGINVVPTEAPQIAAPDQSAMRTRIEDTLDMSGDVVAGKAGERFRELTNVDELLASQEGVTADRQALYDKVNDPARQKRDRMIAFLTGGANRSSLGSVAAGATAASTNLQRQQETTQANQLNERRAEFERMVEQNRELGMAQSEAEDNALQRLTSEKGIAMQGGIELDRQSAQLAGDNLQAKMTQAGIDADVAMNAARNANDLLRTQIEAETRMSAAGSGDYKFTGLTADDILAAKEMIASDPQYQSVIAARTKQMEKEGIDINSDEGIRRLREVNQLFLDQMKEDMNPGFGNMVELP